MEPLDNKVSDQPDDGDGKVSDDFSEMVTIQPPVNCKKGKHSFRLVTGREAECAICHTGYYIGLGSEVKEGHIYIHGSLVV